MRIVAALALAVPVVVGPASPAAAAPSLTPGFNIASFSDLGNVISGGVTDFAYLPSGQIVAISKTGFVGVGPPPGGAGTWTRLAVNGVADAPVSVNSDGDRGLVGLALSSDFSTSRHVYLLYDYNATGNCNLAEGPGTVCGRLSRWTLDDANNPTNIGAEAVIIDDLPSYSPTQPGNGDNSHTVGTVLVAPDGSLFVGNGDASSYNVPDQTSFQAQNLDSPRGKIFRINPDGTGVSTNPFYGQNPDPSSWRSRIFAYGLRNPFRFSLKPGTSATLYIGHVGSSSREAIDVAKGGENFGWPCYEGELTFRNGFSTDAKCVSVYSGQTPYPNLTAPLWDYAHYGQQGGNAIIGGVFYTGTAYGSYNGAYFFGDNPAGVIWNLRTDAQDALVSAPLLNQDMTPPLQNGVPTDAFGTSVGYPTAFHNAPNGDIVYGDILQNRIYEVQFGCLGGICAPVVQASVTPVAGGPGTSFTFDASASYDPNSPALPLTYAWDFGDGRGASGPVVTHSSAGLPRQNWVATVTVTNGVRSNTFELPWSTLHAPPSLSLTPDSPGLYRVGQPVTITANATGFDTSDAPYPIGGPSVSWQLFIHHCPPGAGGCHLHPDTPSPQPLGSQFSTTVPDHGDNSYLEFRATATDHDGITTTASFSLPMDKHSIVIDSNVPGSQVTVNSQLVNAPVVETAITNSQNQVTAAPTANGLSFYAWSDGTSTQIKQFTMPAGDVHLSACYGGPCAAPTGPGTAPPGLYSPVTPYRLLDTRQADTSPTGIAGPLAPGQTLAVDMTGKPGAPVGATAVLLNVTTDGPQAAGYVKAFPCGTEPSISTVNFDAGQTAANLATVLLPSDHRVCFMSLVPTNVIVDVSGWFAPRSGDGGSGYTSVQPTRVLDTRSTAPLRAGQEMRFDLTSQAGVPADASAALINLTATNTTGPGYVRVYPCGEEQNVSNVNYAAGQTVANLAAVKVAGGAICFRSYATTDIVVDLAGWYAPSGTGWFVAASPQRLFDTRSTPGLTRLQPMEELPVPLVGAQLPANATSVVLNVTAAAPDAAGYVAVYPCGTNPSISNVNYRAGQVAAANLAVVKLAPDGRECFESFASADIVVDLAGWYIG
jgi:glucose/arabinose dehydrogenase